LGPATSAVLTSEDKMPFSSTTSLSVSYSATTFSNPHQSQIKSHHSSFNNGDHPSLSSIQNNSSSSMRGMKKTSWSDECGNRSLVEYSYFDDSSVPPKSNHWSAMKRNSSRSSRHSFDGVDQGFGARRGEVRVIKSALKRSGSYSPPVTLYSNNSKGMTDSNSSPAESSSSTPEMKSFRSLSVIGSSFDSSTSDSSEHENDGFELSHNTDDTRLSNSNECVPSTLQFGCGRASGGLIIPRGGPSDPRYYFPGGSSDSRYTLILGAGIPTTHEQQGEQDDMPAQDASSIVIQLISQSSSCNCQWSKQPWPSSLLAPPSPKRIHLSSVWVLREHNTTHARAVHEYRRQDFQTCSHAAAIVSAVSVSGQVQSSFSHPRRKSG